MQGFREFIGSYLPFFGREEVRRTAQKAIEALLIANGRKSAENLAEHHGVPERAMQRLVGTGAWPDEPILNLLRSEIAEEIADEDGVLILRRAFVSKKGNKSAGVARQWNERLGNWDNCQQAILLLYATKFGIAIVDRRLFMPEEWITDQSRLEAARCPAGMQFQPVGLLAKSMVMKHPTRLPHRWILADQFLLHEGSGDYNYYWHRYQEHRPYHICPIAPGMLMRNFDTSRIVINTAREFSDKKESLSDSLPHAGLGGLPQTVRAYRNFCVKTNEKAAGVEPAYRRKESLLVVNFMNSTEEPRYFVTDRDYRPLEDVVRVALLVDEADQVIERARRAVGLDQYEVRSWIGWHHHMTLCLIAHWYLVRQEARRRKAAAGRSR